MDRDLLRQCLTYHGDSLFGTLKCEQIENPDFQAIVSDLSKATYERRNAEEGSYLVEQFISRKADILFCPTWKTATPEQLDHEVEEASDPCAILPPLELFMEVSYEERRAMLYRDLERGDAVVGRINNIREYGFFLTLLCMAAGLERDIEDLEVSALCHIKEIPSTGSHDDPLSYYQIGDLIRASVKDIDRYQEKITASLHPSSLSPSTAHIKLGVIAREELPRHYSRSLQASSDTSETYERLLRGGHGYHNPSVVDYLLGKVGISETQPPSLMRGLQSKHFHEEDFACVIRKKQSASWALKCVRAGVDHFKHGRHVDAMNEYNKALEIDINNVEALVARGALYANKGSITKAIADFELGLENCPAHRNAKKYLCQTLVERGKQLQEQEKLVTAEGLYRRALSLDETYPEAQDALRKITDTIQKSIRLREEALAKEQEKAKSETSAEKLRKILKEEKRMKRKGKRTSSSSSTSSSTSTRGRSSDSDTSSRRRSKKRRKKGRRSGRRSKRHRRLSSKDDGRSSERKRSRGCTEAREEEGEWCPEPPNTSATFLGRKGGPCWGEGPEEDEDDRRISRLYSLSAASEDEAPDKEQRRGKQRERSREREAGRRRSRDNRSTEREAGRRRSRDNRSTEREAGRRRSRDNRDKSSSREAGRSCRDNRDKSSSREAGRSCRDDGDRSRDVGRSCRDNRDKSSSRETGRSCNDNEDRSRKAEKSCRDDGDRSREAEKSCRDDGDRSRETGKKVNGGDRRVSGASSKSLDRRSQGELSSSSSSSSSCSSAEYCRKSHSASGKPDRDRKSADPSSSMRSTLDGSRYEGRGLQESREREGAPAKEGACNSLSGVTTAPPGSGPKKDLPTNLLDIFNQIAQFEKEKGVRPKK